MDAIPPQALQFAGSLLAILVLAWLVQRMGLGKTPLLDSDDDASRAAHEVSDSFVPAKIARDASGKGAVLQDTAGRIMVLKPHGVHFAGRILDHRATVALDGSRLIIDTGEARFGAVSLEISAPNAWVEAIDRLDTTHDA